MISAASRPYIDASVPVLREHGLAITTLFYKNMLAEHPELTRVFNMGNQASGAQQGSLASAVFAYAANIGNPEALGPVVNRIVHKHVSIGIRAEHYPIVGKHLLAAISHTLGDAATQPLLDAWLEAYGSLANLLIAAEAEMYSTAGIEPGATRPMRVTQVKRESANVLSIRFVPLDDKPLPPFKAGQYVSVAVDLPGGRHQLRQYSLSDAVGLDSLRISVKREDALDKAPAGAVSNWIHANVKEGSVLQVTHPFGEFTPDTESEAPIVLLAAGVGITPMVSALNRIALVHPQRRVIFAYAAHDAAHHPLRDDVAAAQARMPNLHVAIFYEHVGDATGVLAGRMEIARLPQWDLAETDVWLCGPLKFMQAQWLALLDAGVPAAKLHREVFGPDLLDHLL
ncbi:MULTISPECIES: globin domain-containing protein [unclassified Massilia]|uniref:globin domain-containing protein n=1 Tax=unclassified Massilia TaxID=2609279 RepID=UPI001780E542|nr:MULTISPECIES: globin domain-containing protein [unclassified Massilia]MBD8530953.1 flavohemoprotein [Massilia sp. CFBP 13647]MBD8674634.1 flavohemoprotein [Massilia sp. CFBP 13721]